MKYDVLREWVDAGNDVNQLLPRYSSAADPKTTLLIAICESVDLVDYATAMAEYLARRGASLTLADPTGTTPLSAAAFNNDLIVMMIQQQKLYLKSLPRPFETLYEMCVKVILLNLNFTHIANFGAPPMIRNKLSKLYWEKYPVAHLDPATQSWIWFLPIQQSDTVPLDQLLHDENYQLQQEQLLLLQQKLYAIIEHYPRVDLQKKVVTLDVPSAIISKNAPSGQRRFEIAICHNRKTSFFKPARTKYQISFLNHKIHIFPDEIKYFEKLLLLLDMLDLPHEHAYPFLAFLFGYQKKLDHDNKWVVNKDEIMYPIDVQKYKDYLTIPSWYEGLVAFWKVF